MARHRQTRRLTAALAAMLQASRWQPGTPDTGPVVPVDAGDTETGSLDEAQAKALFVALKVLTAERADAIFAAEQAGGASV